MPVVSFVAVRFAASRENFEFARFTPGKFSLPNFVHQRARRSNVTDHQPPDSLAGVAGKHPGLGRRKCHGVIGVDHRTWRSLAIGRKPRRNIHGDHRDAFALGAFVHGTNHCAQQSGYCSADSRSQQCVDDYVSRSKGLRRLLPFVHGANHTRRAARFLPPFAVRTRITLHFFRRREQIHRRIRAQHPQVPRHHESVAAVISLATQHHDPALLIIGKTRLDESRHARASVLHQRRR